MLLVLEGVDCSGKSTVGRRIAERIPSAVYYATPPERFKETRTAMDRDASPEAHYAFYRDAIFEASVEIQALLERHALVVCDRYWLTTHVYHVVMGLPVTATDFDSVVQPDITALLTVGPVVQQQRFGIRGMSEGDKRMLTSQARLAEEYGRACTLLPHVITIKTDELTIDEVAQKIIDELH